MLIFIAVSLCEGYAVFLCVHLIACLLWLHALSDERAQSACVNTACIAQFLTTTVHGTLARLGNFNTMTCQSACKRENVHHEKKRELRRNHKVQISVLQFAGRKRQIKEHIRNDQGKLATKPLATKPGLHQLAQTLPSLGRSPHDGGRLTDEVSLRLCPKQ